MKTYLLYIMSLLSLNAISQSNTPCTAGVISAPALPVNAGCTFTSGTTAGATAQTNANNGGTPSCGSMGPDVWYTFTAPASGSVLIQTTAGTITDGVMGLYSGTCGAFTELGCNDDASGLMPELSTSGLTPGVTYLIRFWEFGGGTGTFNICITAAAAPAGNTTCALPSPVCSGSPISFVANAGGVDADAINPNNDYDCLISQPNPSWYYLEIATSGNLVIDITAGSDVDYAIWGPFPNLANAISNCNAYAVPEDCSFSIAAIEQAVVNGVLAGQVYVLLVTNYANVVQTININEAAANTASTNCAIVPLPVELISFDAKREGNRVQISWVTNTEINCDYFVLERSLNGLEWSAFDLLEGHGTSSETNYYASTDSNPAEGNAYYRLKQYDQNGTITLSEIIKISSVSVNEITIYPNPAKDNVQFFSQDAITTIEFLDLRGNVVQKYTYDNVYSADIQLNDELSGLYFVKIYSANNEEVRRLIIE